MSFFHLTLRSLNSKLGRIAASTSSWLTCPPDCGLFFVCYGKFGPQSWHANKVTAGERGDGWARFLDKVRALKPGSIFRHNVSGDLRIDSHGRILMTALEDLADACRHLAHAWTYTHHKSGPTDDATTAVHNYGAIRWANRHTRLVVNRSCDSLDEVDRRWGEAPLVVALPASTVGNITTPDGHRVVICPAVTGRAPDCRRCLLCARRDRTVAVGFPAHGQKKGEVV